MSSSGDDDDSSTASAAAPQKRKRIPALIPPNNNLGEDELLMKGFYDLMQIKADNGEFQRILQEPNDRRGVTDALRPSFYLASASAVATFVFLRKVPRWYMNKALSKRESVLHGAAGHPHYDSSRRQKNVLFPRIQTHRDGSTSFHEGWLMKPLTLAIDLSVSLATGAAVWFYAMDKKGAFQAVSDIPLVEGRSAVSDTLCEDFILQKNRVPKRLWKEYNDDAVIMLREFIFNCQRRMQLERQIRMNRGLSHDEAVDIPPPGVSPTMILEDVEEEKITGLFGAGWAAEDDHWAEEDDDWDGDNDDDKGFWSQ